MTARTGGRGRDDDGIVAVMTVLLVVAVVGLAAMVVDLGAVYVERRQLQNGADAAAIAVARQCAAGACGSTVATAQSMANANSSDGASAIDSVTVTTSPRNVTVRTSTKQSDTSTKVPFHFAQVLGFDGTTVHASAVAAWGPPKHAVAVSMALSNCDWSLGTNNGTSFTPPGPPWPTTPQEILYHAGTGNGAPPSCNGPANQLLSGGFGWLDSKESGCNVGIDDVGWSTESSGNHAHNGCKPTDLLNHTVLVPIYDNASGSGTNGQFHIRGFAAFYITGFNFPGSGWQTTTCSFNASCLKGFFTRLVLPATSGVDPYGPDLGGVTVSLVS